MPHFQNSMGKKRPSDGIVLWIVVVILLFTSILALSLSRFKSSEVSQLSRTIDRSRLAAFAGSIIAEAMNVCKYQANRPGKISEAFRSVFAAIPSGKRSPDFPYEDKSGVLSFSKSELPQTSATISEAGYNFEPKAEIRIIYTSEVNKFGSSAFRGFLEIHASVNNGNKSLYRLLERREIRALDMIDFFDKYALFVKYYPGWDVNRVDRRLTVIPLEPDFSRGLFSRIYLGKEDHPSCPGKAFETVDPIHGIFLDLSYNSGNDSGDSSGKGYGSNLVKMLMADAKPTDISPIQAAASSRNFNTQSFFYKVVPWSSFAGTSKEIFNFIGVKKHYLVSIVKPAVDNNPSGEFADYSAAHKFVLDFENRNPKFSLGELLADESKVMQTDFSNCAGFQMLVNSYERNWKYHFAYLGADDIWDMAQWENGKPDLQNWRPMIKDDPSKFYYSGIRSFVTWAQGDSAGSQDNGQLQVGRMQRFWGERGDRPAFMEGDIYLRFFKVGFFDEFSDTLNLMKTTVSLKANPTPLAFSKPGSKVDGEEFLYKDRNPLIDPVSVTVSGAGYPLESSLMSRGVSNIPFNRLLGKTATSIKPAINYTSEISPSTSDSVVKPTSKGGGSALDMYPIISPSAFSLIYDTGPQFLAAHGSGKGGKIHLDGKILIRQGPLDLRSISKYSGCGVIKVNEGDIILRSLEKDKGSDVPTRLTLNAGYGKIRVEGKDSAVIEASVLATSFMKGRPENGRGIGMIDFCDSKEVQIKGNLVVDHLNLATLSVGGHLIISHDPMVFLPDDDQHYRISISKARTLFALDSDVETTGGTTP